MKQLKDEVSPSNPNVPLAQKKTKCSSSLASYCTTPDSTITESLQLDIDHHRHTIDPVELEIRLFDL
jgi:hypothetical protein